MSLVDLTVRPLKTADTQRHFLVLLEKTEYPNQDRNPAEDERADPRGLSAQLASARAYLQSIIEELRTANEEAQSSNEELQSTNEELQTAKEELQSSNEELTTINEEMVSRNGELSDMNNDLVNLLRSTQIPIVMLNRDLRVRRYTPSSEKVLKLIPSDIGRPVSDLKPRIEIPDLEKALAAVIDSATVFEREVQDKEGCWYSLRIHPYRTTDNRIEGAVLQLVDIDPLKRTIEAAEAARKYSEAIIATVREPLLVLDRDLNIKTANQSFIDTFRVAEKDLAGTSIYQLRGGDWNFPSVRQMLGAVLSNEDGHVQDVEIEHDFTGIGWRIFQLNARVVHRTGELDQILLALEDITDRKRAAEAKFRRLFETAKDGIVIADALTGQITDANPYVTELFGYPREEMIGVPFWQAKALTELQDGKEILERIRVEKIVRYSEATLHGKRRSERRNRDHRQHLPGRREVCHPVQYPGYHRA